MVNVGSQSSLLSNMSTNASFISNNISNVNLNPQPPQQQQQQQQQQQIDPSAAANMLNMQNLSLDVNGQARTPTTFASTFAPQLVNPMMGQQGQQQQQQQPFNPNNYFNVDPNFAANMQQFYQQQQQQFQLAAAAAAAAGGNPAFTGGSPLVYGAGAGAMPNFGVPAELNPNTNQMVQSLVQQTISNHQQQQQAKAQFSPLANYFPAPAANVADHSHSHSHGHGHSHEHGADDHSHSH